MSRRGIATAVLAALFWASGPAGAADVSLHAAGPVGLGYVGMYYGLADPADGSWYVGADFFGLPTTAWMAVADTGASGCILGKSTQQAYLDAGAGGIPLQPYPQVHFTDEGFGGTVDFAVTEPVQVMIADFRTADVSANPENPALYQPYGPAGGPEPPSLRMAAALEPIGGGDIDFDIIGMSIMGGRVLHVDPHYLQFLRWMLIVMAGSLEQPPPPPSETRAVYVPIDLEGFFDEPQPIEVGDHPMVSLHVRRAASNRFATCTAIFDTGSPVNFVSESFAVEAGVDLDDPPDMTITVTGLGPGQAERPGYYVDALALDLGRGREGDQLVVDNTAVFVIPDESMPGELEAILGNGIFSPSSQFQDTTVTEWYVDTRDPANSHIIVVLPALPGDANFDGQVDGVDYTFWSDHYLQEGFWGDGDFNEDGIVNGTDYCIWADNFGAGGAAVPAPPVALLLVGALAVVVRPRRQ